MMNTLLRAAGALCLAVTLAACGAPATTPMPHSLPASEAPESAWLNAPPRTLETLPPIGRNEARIVLFRSSHFGFAVQPRVFVDDVDIGRCSPRTVRTIKVLPGFHEVSATAEVKKTNTLRIANGQTAYVKCSIGLGFFVGRIAFERVPEATAMQKAGKFKVQ